MARYSIDGQILTDIGDAIRAKKGENPYHSEGNMIANSGSYLNNTRKQVYKITFTTKSISTGTTTTGKFFYNLKDVSPTYTFTTGEATEGFITIEDIVNKKLMINSDNGNIGGTYILELADENENVLYSYTPEEMAEEINKFPPTPEDKDLIISGNCSYRFAYGGWNWVIQKYGDKIFTKDITSGQYMFGSVGADLVSIPFELNFKNQSQGTDIQNIFNGCYGLLEVPKINGVNPTALSSMFQNCWMLRSIPDDYFDNFDWTYLENLTSQYSGTVSGMFQGCYSLRKLPPLSFVNHFNPNVYGSYSFTNTAFHKCVSLDEVVNVPIGYITGTITSNLFASTVTQCYRLKNFTFAPSGPLKLKAQVLDLSSNVGFSGYSGNTAEVYRYNSGITADKEVKDDATYQALKNDPDWFTEKEAYSRYNHDSAVATINSLPDTSAYLASAGGTNTIKFRGPAGSATDGGAINTLTDAEIAVAAAKGWTVTLA